MPNSDHPEVTGQHNGGNIAGTIDFTGSSVFPGKIESPRAGRIHPGPRCPVLAFLTNGLVILGKTEPARDRGGQALQAVPPEKKPTAGGTFSGPPAP